MSTQQARFSIMAAALAAGTLACICGSGSSLERFEPTLDASTVDLTLGEGMEIDIRPLDPFAKQVSHEPVNPGRSDGGSRLTVTSYDGTTLVLRLQQTLEITEEELMIPDVPPPNVEDGSIIIPTFEIQTPDPNAPPPETRIVPIDTTITVTGIATSHGPMMTPYGDPAGAPITTDGSLIWLSVKAYSELTTNGSTAWDIDALSALSSLPEFAGEIIEGEGMFLTDTGTVEMYEVRINGRKSEVEAIIAIDDFGNTYYVMRNETNPLILQFLYNPEGAGMIGVDMPAWALVKSLTPGYGVVEIRTP